MHRNLSSKIATAGTMALASIALAALTACGGSQGNPVASTLSQTQSAPTPTQVSVVPATLQVAAGGSFQFSVNVLPAGASSAVTWSASGAGCSGASCGTIDAGGRYLAPASVPIASTVTVTATSTADQTKSGTASVTIGPPAQSAGTFTLTGSMTTARTGHTATLLLDGRVLIAGGDAAVSAELYDPATGTFVRTGSMMEFEGGPATLLANGQVLFTGGAIAQLYDPAAGIFIPTGRMRVSQGVLAATLLASGKVLVAGDTEAELYDPATGTFAPAGPYASTARGFGSTAAILLSDGRVLFIGGGDSPNQIYDPVTDTFSLTGSLTSADYLGGVTAYSATLLSNGKVLVAGGRNDDRFNDAELFDPATGTFSLTSGLHSFRDSHTATLLPGGKVLIAGGEGCGDVSNCGFNGSLAGTELYDPATGSFTVAANMNATRVFHRATLLKNGDVLITGGSSWNAGGLLFPGTSLATAELYHPRLSAARRGYYSQ